MREWSIICLLLAGGRIAAPLLRPIIHAGTAPGLTRIKRLQVKPFDVEGEGAGLAAVASMEYERC
jgi:hypothetical protein